MDTSSYVNFSNIQFIQELYKLYLENPSFLAPSWKAFFDGYSLASETRSSQESDLSDLNTYLLVENFRRFGHLEASCNPLKTKAIKLNCLDPLTYGFLDFNQIVPTFGVMEEHTATLQTLIEKLRKTYLKSIGYEYREIGDFEKESWIQQHIEKGSFLNFAEEEKIRLFEHLVKADLFENFLHTKFVGQKRFSLEGCTSAIPTIHTLMEVASHHFLKETVIGMAHRGRLNVLCNVMGKPYSDLFQEFSEHYVPAQEGSGDVKYHKGYIHNVDIHGGKAILATLCANPSHLEAIDSILEGLCKAKEAQYSEECAVLPLLIHGDASIAGQGVVYETLQMSRLKGYQTGGTIHLIINNQVGFTASPDESRSTLYCTDIAKTFGSPVIHVDAEDILACAAAAKLALQIRNRFHCDVFIDLIGYRKWGHNESDEPSYTQPLLYEEIRAKESPSQLFSKELINQGINPARLSSIEENVQALLQAAFDNPTESPTPKPLMGKAKAKLSSLNFNKLQEITKKLTLFPAEFTLHEKLKRLVKDRSAMLDLLDLHKIDWGFAEQLAFATLLQDGFSVRLSGQDSARGTFSHRHALFVDAKTQSRYIPLSALAKEDSSFQVYNSFLSEFAALGFEYGYTLGASNTLVLWEAQYGDFANGAQVIIDQFLASSEQKWGQKSNLTVLLPHGYEGQGPEHSSARIERYLQLCAQNNWTVAIPSTAKQYFHLLRKQAQESKPCIIFTPKSFLRNPDCACSPKELIDGHFEALLFTDHEPKAETLILTYGKFFYELKAEKLKRGRSDMAIARLEQLYPLNLEPIEEFLSHHKNIKKIVVVQEEPENMGALQFLMWNLEPLTHKGIILRGISRAPSASTAAGSSALHKKELKLLFETLFKE